jgi:thiol-disulfide isomerase/thioredoxin
MGLRRGAHACVFVAGLLAAAPHTHESRATELSPWLEGDRPQFTLDSLAGERVSLAAHGDRVVLVHFFATWCEPCRAEMAALQRLADRFAQRPFAILAVDVGEVDSRVRKFFESVPVTFPI